MEKIVKEIIKHKKTCYFVSPHLDDAAFSAGGLISYLAGKTKVVVITVFTRAARDNHSLSALAYVKMCGYDKSSIDKFYTARRSEDKALFDSLGVECIHLGLYDALWRRKRSLNIIEKLSTLFVNELRYIYPTHRLHISKGKIYKEDEKNLKKLENRLKKIIGEDDNGVVFCPLGLGTHVDHIMVREACTNVFPNVLYWEDSPYNLYHELDKNYIKSKNLKKKIFRKNLSKRKAMYPSYKTQFAKLFNGETNFSLPPEAYYMATKIQDEYKKLENIKIEKIIQKHFQSRRCKGLIFGNFGSMNMGDEAILAAELTALDKLGKIEITVIGRYPSEIRKIHKKEAYSYFDFAKIIKLLIKTDFVIFGGGGLFCRNSWGLIGFSFQLYYLILFILMPLILRKKIFVVGVGFYKNTNYFIRHMALLLLRFVNHISVRDFHSFNLLKNHGVKVKIKKDLAFNLELETKRNDKSNSSRVYNVGLSITNTGSRNLNIKLVKKLSDTINKSTSYFRYYFFPLDLDPHSIDLKLGKEIYQRLSKANKKKFSIVLHNSHPKLFFKKFGKMDYFLAMRLHAMIFSYRLGIDFEGMGYDEKCYSFLESIGKRNLDINEFVSSLEKRI